MVLLPSIGPTGFRQRLIRPLPVPHRLTSFRHPSSILYPSPLRQPSFPHRPPSFLSFRQRLLSFRQEPTGRNILTRSRPRALKSSFLYIFIYIYVGTMIYCSYSDSKIGTIQGGAWLVACCLLKCWNFCRVPKGTHIPCYFIPVISARRSATLHA